MQSRTLRLNSDALTELDTDDLAAIAAAGVPTGLEVTCPIPVCLTLPTQGTFCC